MPDIRSSLMVSGACQDHLGNKYTSLADMLKRYHMPYSAYSSRLQLGWSLEKTLTTPRKKNRTR